MWNFLTDIDNTLLTFKPDVRVERSTSGVLNVIRKYAVEEKKTAPESVNAKIDFVKKRFPGGAGAPFWSSWTLLRSFSGNTPLRLNRSIFSRRNRICPKRLQP